MTPHAVVNVRDERWQLQRTHVFDACSVIETVGVDARNRGEHGTFVLPFEACAALPAVDRMRRVSLRGSRRLARRVLAMATPSPISLRCLSALKFDPLPFQIEPVLAYLRGDAVRLLIADAVGLGKTLQAGLIVAEMLERHRDGRALIVVPSGLREQWRAELRERLDLDTEILDTEGLWRAASRLPAGINPWSVPRTVITSIDLIKRPEVLRSLEPLVWDVVVFDEAHTLSGRSDRHLAASGLARRARAVILLTATPHDGNDDAFDRLCSLGDLDGRFPVRVFNRSHHAIGRIQPRKSVTLAIHSSPDDTRLHAALFRYARDVWSAHTGSDARLAMLVLLKRAASGPAALGRSLTRRRGLLASNDYVGEAMPQTLPFFDEGDEEPAGQLGARGLLSREDELSRLETLIALAANASVYATKLGVLRRLFRRVREPVIVFTQYRDTLDELRNAFGDCGPVCIQGGMSTRERREAAAAFTRGSARLLLATDAASEGLNLHARCRLVIHFDLPWTPLRIEQRVGRVDRLGQARPVHAWQLVSSGTYEEIVADRVRARAAAARAAIGRLRPEEEHDTAAAILADAPVDVPQVTLPFNGGSSSEAAIVEADRVRRGRAWLRHASRTAPRFPFIARRHTSATRLLVVYQIHASDSSRLQIWSSVVGILLRASASRIAEFESLARTPSLLEYVRQSSSPRWHDEYRLWRHAAATWLRRDRAIGHALDADRARLSAVLMQPGLFYTRRSGEDEQLCVLDRSLARLRRASAETRAIGRVELSEAALVFAVALRPAA